MARMSSARKELQGVKRKSQYRGVSWSKWDAKWQAYIYKDRKMYHLGLFTDEKLAAQVRDNALVDFECNLSNLNFPARETET